MTTARRRTTLALALLTIAATGCSDPVSGGGPDVPTRPTARTTTTPVIPVPAPTPTPSSSPSASPSLPTTLPPSPVSAGTTAAPPEPAPEPGRVDLGLAAAAGPAVEAGDAAGSGAFEPVVATHPTDPTLLAIAYTRATQSRGDMTLAVGIRVSRDGGRTWRETRRHPWDGSRRRPSLHSALAWGPGPNGRARLYWTGTTTGGGVRVAIAHSDDLGASWSRLHVVRDTPAWVGGFPDITVDRNPASPGYGHAYVAYAFPAAKARGAGIRLLASTDFGRTWRGTNVPRAPTAARYPVSWRFGCRVRTGPDGAVFVSSYQADLRRWDAGDVFDRGGSRNVGRIGFTVTRLTVDPDTGKPRAGRTVMATTIARNAWTTSRRVAPGTRSHTYLDPMWTHGLDVDPGTGRVYLAVGHVAARPARGAPRGTVRVGRSDDAGRTWAWVTVPAMPEIDGQRQSAFKPTLAVGARSVVVGLHTIDDVAAREAWSADARIGTAVALSTDGGRTFTTPTLVTRARWRASALERAANGPGLRDRIELAADGRVVYAYADARLASASQARAPGPRQVYVTWITIHGGGPRPPGDRSPR